MSRLTLLILSVFIISNSIWGQSFTAMTYNIKYDDPTSELNSWNDRKESLIELMKFYQPSIIGTQEGLLHQLEYIDSALVDYTYFGKGRDDGKKEGEFSAIFYDSTQFTARNINTFWLSEKMTMPSYGWGANYRRICTYALFKNKETGDEFWVFNVHYDHENKLSRINSSKLLLEVLNKVNSKNLPVIIMGDFNSQMVDEPMKILNSILAHSFNNADQVYGPFGTYNGFNLESPLNRRIDHILVRGIDVKLNLTIDDRRDNNLYISDHFPVLINAEIKKR
ncbi:endonuclease/exonuclease/phosphatase family protein [Mangrovivirga sp. M17]|uniref:Endonuclease/exonuclease/phosphatase family protein n=1 Tax=Mangrovivirga halotolerans TaxID=2993936 RepID=A0ABT3RME7_9BACT|nr:endonuclease/exonuclease/phosphatase family protein [Mangrovivirga halotolerans]MCX2742782.1 endonuclease/exonuclease/phosphatase family protein [Mangrovivirga halotolerans]